MAATAHLPVASGNRMARVNRYGTRLPTSRKLNSHLKMRVLAVAKSGSTANGKSDTKAANGTTTSSGAARQRVQRPPNSTSTKWPTFTPDPKYIRPDGKAHKTILTIDGGGLRGMLAARLLEELEMTIKETLVMRQVPGLLTLGNLDVDVPKETKLEDLNLEFNIDLADYFDIMSGTSTGSIVAAYLATKGQLSHDFLKNDHDMVALSTGTGAFQTKDPDVKSYYQRFAPEYLRPGSCRAIQAVFAAKAETIFPKDLKDYLGLSMVDGIFKSKYPAEGINKVLKSVFGGLISNNPKNKDQQKADVSDKLLRGQYEEKSDKGVKVVKFLHTSLVIPAFHLDLTRTMTFWYKHDHKEPKCGYATLARNTSKTEFTNATNLMKEWFGQYQAEHKKEGMGPGTSEIIYVPDVDFYLWQVVRSSTAAPTFFPVITLQPMVPDTWVVEDEDMDLHEEGEEEDGAKPPSPAPWKLVDGGLTANNPGAAAITFATSAFPEVTSLNQLAVLSIGCGSAMAPTSLKSDDAGQLGWVSSLINVLLSGNQEMSSALMDHFISKKYTNSAEAVPEFSDRYVRIQKSVFRRGSKASALDTVDMAHSSVQDIRVGRVSKSVTELLQDMDRTDSKLHYIALAESMLDEQPALPDTAILEKYKRFAEDYLVPDLNRLNKKSKGPLKALQSGH